MAYLDRARMIAIARQSRVHRPPGTCPGTVEVTTSGLGDLLAFQRLGSIHYEAHYMATIEHWEARSAMCWQAYGQNNFDLAVGNPSLLLRVRLLEEEADSFLRMEERHLEHLLDLKRKRVKKLLSVPGQRECSRCIYHVDEDGVVMRVAWKRSGGSIASGSPAAKAKAQGGAIAAGSPVRRGRPPSGAAKAKAQGGVIAAGGSAATAKAQGGVIAAVNPKAKAKAQGGPMAAVNPKAKAKAQDGCC